jgi:hypothetical protein
VSGLYANEREMTCTIMANSVRSVSPLKWGLMAINHGVMGADIAKYIEGMASRSTERQKEVRKEGASSTL